MVDKSPLLNNLVQYSHSKPLHPSDDDQKFTIVPIDCMLSTKTMMQQQKPCKAFIEIQFNKEIEINFFNYIVLQNFYSYSVTIKQFKGSID